MASHCAGVIGMVSHAPRHSTNVSVMAHDTICAPSQVSVHVGAASGLQSSMAASRVTFSAALSSSCVVAAACSSAGLPARTRCTCAGRVASAAARSDRRISGDTCCMLDVMMQG
jgi:hypothetical protein